MQLSTKPEIQIHVRGEGLVQLHFAGRCVGFAASYSAAGLEANRLDRLFSFLRNAKRIKPVGRTAEISFSSAAPEMAVRLVTDFTPEVWAVEVGDGIPVRLLPSEEAAQRFCDVLEAYHRVMPPSGENGEWTEAQIDWFRNHPAPVASACGGSLQVRKVEVH